MKSSSIACTALACLFMLSGKARRDEPKRIAVCELQNNPGLYDHQLLEVESFVSHDFEDFTLFDPTCRKLSVWIEYGGKRKSDTVYCCGPTAGKNRPKQLMIEKIPIPLVENEQFKAFDREVQPPFRSERHGSIVRAKLIGRFFAGQKETFPNGETGWTGFGHMGCCSLFVIQEVKSVDPQDRDDLDYGASADQPDIDKAGCGFQFLRPIEPGSDAVEAQRKAEADPNSKAFDDPTAVAADFLAARIKGATPIDLRVKRRAPGRIVYESAIFTAESGYMVVMSRMYWLSLYARDPHRIAWLPVAAYKLSCENENSVTRIK